MIALPQRVSSQHSVWKSACLSLAVLVGATSSVFGQTVEFEIATESGLSPTVMQKWAQVFQGIRGTSFRIRAARGSDMPKVENRGSDTSPRFHVVAIIDQNERLVLPHSRPVTMRQVGEIRDWIERVKSEGAARMGTDLGAFGLTKKELLDFHEQLKLPFTASTLNVRSGDVARRLVRGAGIEFEVTSAARQAFAGQDLVGDELRGLSHGTALAAVLRPLGLVASPQHRSGKVVLQIAAARETEEAWPVGWPSQDSPYKTAPALFDYLTFEIDDVSLRRALDAIGDHIKMPILLDHNRLAALQVDLEATKVSFPSKRTFFKKVLDVLLFQARLTSEIRVDEAGTPFIWITSTR